MGDDLMGEGSTEGRIVPICRGRSAVLASTGCVGTRAGGFRTNRTRFGGISAGEDDKTGALCTGCFATRRTLRSDRG